MPGTKTTIVARNEYVRIVKRRSFWITILALPVFYLVIAFVAGTAGQSAEKKIAEEVASAKQIIVVDQCQCINDALLAGDTYVRSDDMAAAEMAVRDGTADAALTYPADVAESKTIKVYVRDTGLLSGGKFTPVATNLLKQSILLGLNDPQQIALFNANLTTDTTLVKDGVESQSRIENYLVPIIAIVLYFMLVLFSSAFMLSSVAEEKENRVIESLLATIKPRQLITGKIIGLSGVAFTQMATLLAFGLVANTIASRYVTIPIDWSMVHVGIGNILLALLFILTGFLFISSIMVGVGASMQTYRDAQQFSAIFIILSILPVYLSTLIIADPYGVVSRVATFFPFTASMLLLFRSTIDALPTWELLLGIFAVIVYAVGGIVLALKLFELGSVGATPKFVTQLMRRKKLVKL